MSPVNQAEVAFSGVRVRFESDKSIDEVMNALLDDVGHQPVPIDSFAARYHSWQSYADAVASHVGPSGFILFATFNYGAWIAKTGIDRKVMRFIIGNPLIAITMLRHDVTAGLFAPVELLLADEPGERCSLTYVKPSSLMVVEPNEPLLAAATELDHKLEALAAKVTS